MNRIFGYIRVSTSDQNIARQIVSMNEQGVPEENIFIDHQSGKNFDRPAYKRLVRKLRKSDLLIIHELDRLGRNYNEILEQWAHICKKKMADIRVLDMPILDTTIHKDLLGTLISDIVLQLLSYTAQKTRENIRKGQREGIDDALSKGVKFGREFKEIPDDFEEKAALWRTGKITIKQLADHCKVSESTVRRRARELDI